MLISLDAILGHIEFACHLINALEYVSIRAGGRNYGQAMQFFEVLAIGIVFAAQFRNVFTQGQVDDVAVVEGAVATGDVEVAADIDGCQRVVVVVIGVKQTPIVCLTLNQVDTKSTKK